MARETGWVGWALLGGLDMAEKDVEYIQYVVTLPALRTLLIHQQPSHSPQRRWLVRGVPGAPPWLVR